MQSIRLLAVLTGTVTLASACGGDGGTPPDENQAPVAIFTSPTNCVAGVACNFTNASTDDAAVTTWSWDFDGAGTAPNVLTSSASFTFAAQGTFPVTLTVGDAQGLTNAVTQNVIVAAAPGPVNVAPTASFTFVTPNCTAGTPCGFHSTSTDADGTVAGWAWNFGDATTPGETEDVTHTYAAAGTYTVTLTVTDNRGLASTAATQQLVVSAPASQDCTTTGRTAACTLTPSARVTIKITVVSTACELSGNKLEVTAPRLQTAFFNLCNRTPGEEYTVTDAAGAPLVFEAGTPIALKFTGGAAGPNNPPTGDAGIQITGSYPNWT
ncbi:MAG: PKD domain-containing protein, partial [Gemmatimonadales bacterium]|nr:PKD domain-containing protein [Gemmatimonadales bacterium]